MRLLYEEMIEENVAMVEAHATIMKRRISDAEGSLENAITEYGE